MLERLAYYIIVHKGVVFVFRPREHHKGIIVTKGVVASHSKKNIDTCIKLVEKAVKEKLLTKTSFAELKTIIKDITGDYLFDKTHSRPMIIPVILTKNP